MKRIKLEELLKKLEKELETAEKRYSLAKSDAEKMSKETASSWSSGGDRVYSQGQADILKRNLESIKTIKTDVDNALNAEFSGTVMAPSYVEIEFSGNKMDFFLVENPIHLEKTIFISTDSEIGKAITGKKVDDEFAIQKEAKDIVGKVLKIE